MGSTTTAALCSCAFATMLTAGAGAGGQPPWSLFNPVPADLMRPMSTDRPDQIESAYTVDAGHVQLEMDFFNCTTDHGGGVRRRAWSVAPLNIKAGVLDSMDLQIVFEPYLHEREVDGRMGAARTVDGAGDLTFRMKVNLWGNDGGPTALAVMPFVTVPTAARGLGVNGVEGGLIFPMAVSLGKEWGLNLMTELDLINDDAGGGHHVDFVNAVGLSHDFTERFGAYVECFTVLSSAGRNRWQAQVDFGFTFAVSDNLQLDAGMNIGVTRSAPDLQPFAGISLRF